MLINLSLISSVSQTQVKENARHVVVVLVDFMAEVNKFLINRVFPIYY